MESYDRLIVYHGNEAGKTRGKKWQGGFGSVLLCPLRGMGDATEGVRGLAVGVGGALEM